MSMVIAWVAVIVIDNGTAIEKRRRSGSPW